MVNQRHTSGMIATALAAAGFAWCVGVSVWIWVTPIRSSGFRTEAWSSWGPDGAVSAGARTVPFAGTHRFSERSLLGPLPLVVPVLLAGCAAWAAWRNRKITLSVATGALLAFCLLAGFSIGRGYIPGGGLMLWALLALFDAESE